MVLVGVILKDSLGGTTFDRCIKSVQVVVFRKVTSRVHHQLVGTSLITCSSSYPSLSCLDPFYTIPIPLLFNSKSFFYFLISFLFSTACMYVQSAGVK